MLRYTWGAAVLLVGLAAVPAFGQTTLEWKFKQGDKIYVETKTSLKQTVLTMGNKVNQNNEQVVVTARTIKGKVGDAWVIEDKIEAIKDTNPNIADLSQKMKGTTFTVHLDPKKLEIVRFEGYEELLERIAGNDETLKKLVRSLITEETLRSTQRMQYGFLPGKPVQQGDTWMREWTMPFGQFGTAMLKYKYTFGGLDNLNGKKVAKITYEGTATYAPPNPNAGVPGFQVVKGNAKVDSAKGTIYFDPDAGRMVQAESQLRLNMAVTIAFAGMTQDVSTDIDQTEVMKVSDMPPK